MKIITAIALTMLTLVNTVNAQTDQKADRNKPYTLVYDGAITENVKGKVNIHKR